MVQINYSVEPREDILGILPVLRETVLDLGCANGVLGEAIKKIGAKQVIGVEINHELADLAKNRLDAVYVGDIETENFKFKEDFFDLIICADVIEHLKTPEKFLETYLKYLKKGGHLIVSIPNVQYYFVLWSLLNGEWNYVDRGIFDKTHLRFFTLRSITRLLQSAGLEIIKINRNYRLREKYCSHHKIAKYLSLYFFRNFLTFQYVILARKK